MGYRIVGWRACSLQTELGPQGFLAKAQLHAHRRAVEERVPADPRATAHVEPHTQDATNIGGLDVHAEEAAFSQGIPECAACPLSGGLPVGCHRTVTYPIDAITERLVFEFFVSELSRRGSIGKQFYRDVVSSVATETAWSHNRSGHENQTELDAPLVHEWREWWRKKRVDSGQLLAALFMPIHERAQIAVYTRFWFDFGAHLSNRLEGEGVYLSDNGVEIRVRASAGTNEEIERATAEGVSKAKDVTLILRSRTLGELAPIVEMFAAFAQRAVGEGWRVVVEA